MIDFLSPMGLPHALQERLCNNTEDQLLPARGSLLGDSHWKRVKRHELMRVSRQHWRGPRHEEVSEPGWKQFGLPGGPFDARQEPLRIRPQGRPDGRLKGSTQR